MILKVVTEAIAYAGRQRGRFSFLRNERIRPSGSHLRDLFETVQRREKPDLDLPAATRTAEYMTRPGLPGGGWSGIGTPLCGQRIRLRSPPPERRSAARLRASVGSTAATSDQSTSVSSPGAPRRHGDGNRHGPAHASRRDRRGGGEDRHDRRPEPRPDRGQGRRVRFGTGRPRRGGPDHRRGLRARVLAREGGRDPRLRGAPPASARRITGGRSTPGSCRSRSHSPNRHP